VVSIHGPLGYGPSTLPLRHSAPLDIGEEARECMRGAIGIWGAGKDWGGTYIYSPNRELVKKYLGIVEQRPGKVRKPLDSGGGRVVVGEPS
jgi:hypothetical protein